MPSRPISRMTCMRLLANKYIVGPLWRERFWMSITCTVISQHIKTKVLSLLRKSSALFCHSSDRNLKEKRASICEGEIPYGAVMSSVAKKEPPWHRWKRPLCRRATVSKQLWILYAAESHILPRVRTWHTMCMKPSLPQKYVTDASTPTAAATPRLYPSNKSKWNISQESRAVGHFWHAISEGF